jgi:hypothetical protein
MKRYHVRKGGVIIIKSRIYIYMKLYPIETPDALNVRAENTSTYGVTNHIQSPVIRRERKESTALTVGETDIV